MCVAGLCFFFLPLPLIIIKSITGWLAANFLQWNKEKTEVLVVGAKAQKSEYLESRSLIKNQDVTTNGVTSFKDHINSITKVFQLRKIPSISDFLSKCDSQKLIHVFVMSRLDYCKSVCWPSKENHRL